jgi:DNA-binding transcriptional MocR family regulator
MSANGYEIWARRQKLDGWAHARHELLAQLGERTDMRAGVAIVTVEHLAQSVGRSTREVRRYLEQLVRAGLLERIARFVPRQGANAYRLLTEWVKAQRERPEAPAAADAGAAATRVDPRRRLFTLANGEQACIHHTPPCEECDVSRLDHKSDTAPVPPVMGSR